MTEHKSILIWEVSIFVLKISYIWQILAERKEARKPGISLRRYQKSTGALGAPGPFKMNLEAGQQWHGRCQHER